MSLTSSNRFLVVYSATVTAVFVVTVLSGFARQPTTLRLKELTVQRINVVEPNGSPRMIISDERDFPGLIVKGHDFPHRRDTAGILFFNDEGTENGGLIFGGREGKDGNPTSYGHLSFDKYMQDQTLVIQADQEQGHYSKYISLVDQPDYPITDEVPLGAELAAHPDQRQELIRKFYQTHARSQERLYLGEGANTAVSLVLKDRQGRKRLVLRVLPDGTPVLQFLDAGGKVIEQLPGDKAPHHPPGKS